MANYVTKSDLLSFMNLPLQIFSFNKHDNCWSEIKVTQFVSFLETFSWTYDNSTNIQCSNHNHVEISFFPCSFDTKSSIFLVDLFSFYKCLLTYTIQSSFNSSSLFNSKLRWSVETMIISRCKVKNHLIKFILRIPFQSLDFFVSVNNFFAFNQLTQRIRGSLDNWTFVLINFRNFQNFAVSWTNDCWRVRIYVSRFYFPRKECTESFERFKRFNYFIKLDMVFFGVECEEFFS